MNKYWKVKLIEDLLQIEKGEKEGTTITMNYIHYQENMLNLVSKAYEDGWNDAIKELSDAKEVKDE